MTQPDDGGLNLSKGDQGGGGYDSGYNQGGAPGSVYGAPGSAPQYGQPQPGYQQPYGQDPYAQQPAYGQPGYGQQGYGQPGYGQPGLPQGYNPNDPEAPYGRHPQTGEPYSDKQKLVAGLLGIFLGTFGAGRFYLNQPGIAVAQLAVSIVTCGLGGIWGLIDGIMMLTGNVKDQYGRPLRD